MAMHGLLGFHSGGAIREGIPAERRVSRARGCSLCLPWKHFGSKSIITSLLRRSLTYSFLWQYALTTMRKFMDFEYGWAILDSAFILKVSDKSYLQTLLLIAFPEDWLFPGELNYSHQCVSSCCIDHEEAN